MSKAKGAFQLASWYEQQYGDLDDGGKLTRASVTQHFSGDLAGDGAVEWLMCYRSDGTAHFVGLQTVRGVIDDRKGSFVLETSGDFNGTMATWTASVVPGSGTGDLEGIAGSAGFAAPHGSRADFDFEYQLQ
jgi:hypothetical protein